MKFTATIVDEDQAGRPFPVRPITENGQLVRWNHQRAAAYLTDVRLFWADVAAANMRLYDAGCVEALHDV
ncbi:hypothetical protein [Pseudoclavibacter helvolus]|uniref:hypothetical protein n=1 Tax=Pseudoclavibacter helvolus TaxID=255205 RepID=UPI0008382114|nr:hypothetical protein [Pseudoclavibacter helvolus]